MGLVRLGLVLAAALAAGACATSGASPRPFPGAPDPPAAPDAPGAAAVDATEVVKTAMSLQGVPYRNGGSDPKGFDCSGLVQYVFGRHGVALPREVREQAQLGQEIRLVGIEPGDLIFFAIDGSGPSHVGLAVGGDEFVHAPSSRGRVRVEKFSAPYWSRRIVTVRRIP